jgi:hypothetical protein
MSPQPTTLLFFYSFHNYTTAHPRNNSSLQDVTTNANQGKNKNEKGYITTDLLCPLPYVSPKPKAPGLFEKYCLWVLRCNACQKLLGQNSFWNHEPDNLGKVFLSSFTA